MTAMRHLVRNVSKASIIHGSAFLMVVAGALGIVLARWGLFGFYLTGVPLWGFGILAGVGGVAVLPGADGVWHTTILNFTRFNGHLT
jgi:hypothetical protein